jgi:hypothetical protein
VRNAGTIPEVVLSAWVLPAWARQQRSWPEAVRPTPAVRLMWWAGENLGQDGLFCQGILAPGTVQGAGFSR